MTFFRFPTTDARRAAYYHTLTELSDSLSSAGVTMQMFQTPNTDKTFVTIDFLSTWPRLLVVVHEHYPYTGILSMSILPPRNPGLVHMRALEDALRSHYFDITTHTDVAYVASAFNFVCHCQVSAAHGHNPLPESDVAATRRSFRQIDIGDYVSTADHGEPFGGITRCGSIFAVDMSNQ